MPSSSLPEPADDAREPVGPGSPLCCDRRSWPRGCSGWRELVQDAHSSCHPLVAGGEGVRKTYWEAVFTLVFFPFGQMLLSLGHEKLPPSLTCFKNVFLLCPPSGPEEFPEVPCPVCSSFVQLRGQQSAPSTWPSSPQGAPPTLRSAGVLRARGPQGWVSSPSVCGCPLPGVGASYRPRALGAGGGLSEPPACPRLEGQARSASAAPLAVPWLLGMVPPSASSAVLIAFSTVSPGERLCSRCQDKDGAAQRPLLPLF